MDALRKVQKINKKQHLLSSSRVSNGSFASLLQSIKETQNASDDQNFSEFNSPKKVKRAMNNSEFIETKDQGNLTTIRSSDFQNMSIHLSKEKNQLKNVPLNQRSSISEEKSFKNSVNERESQLNRRPNVSANRILQKLGKSFATQNSSKNSAESSFDVIKTTFVSRSKNQRQEAKRWGTDWSKSFKRSSENSVESDFFFDNYNDLNHQSEVEKVQNVSPSRWISLNRISEQQKKPQIKNEKIRKVDSYLKKFKQDERQSQCHEISNLLQRQMQHTTLKPNKQILKTNDYDKTRRYEQKEKMSIREQHYTFREQKYDLASSYEGITSIPREIKRQGTGKYNLRSEMSNYSNPSRRALNTRSKNLYTMTGNIRENPRQYVIAIQEHSSHQIGMAFYNNTTGQIHLCQFIENLTYFRTMSTIETFSPLEIIYSMTFSDTLLIKKLKQKFRQVSYKGVFPRLFDQSAGYQHYLKTPNKQNIQPSTQFLALECFNALICHLQTNLNHIFMDSSLHVSWHHLQNQLVIQHDAIMDLELFYNYQTKTNKQCLMQNFPCITFGGNRMLRANLLQPPSDLNVILQRQNLLQKILQNPSIVDFIEKQFHVYKFYEPITSKFIKQPKQKNFKSLKSYLTSILLLSKQCLSLQKLYRNLEDRNAFDFPIFRKLEEKLKHDKLKTLKILIEDNFEENILKNFDDMKNKIDKFIFLFKIEKIDDGQAAVTRQVYKQTVDMIKKYHEAVRQKTQQAVHLMYNDRKGYFFRVQQAIDLHEFSQKIEQNIVQITNNGKILVFSTQILSSLNNRIQESQQRLVLQSESLLKKVIKQIQSNIDILFEINEILSSIDMIMAFAKYVNRYSSFAKFKKPTFCKGSNKLNIQNVKPVWLLNYEKYKPGEQGKENLFEQISIISQGDSQKVILLQKSQNSISQSSLLCSIAYTIILSQIGCFVPGEKIEFSLFDSILSKIHFRETTELGMSRFELNVAKIQNIFDNCFTRNEGRSLILMDEIVKGSQHEEECALSLATIEHLQKNKGLSIISSSDRMMIQYVVFYNQFKSVKLFRTKHEEKQKRAVEEMAEESIRAMKDFNFDERFIDAFDQIKIQPTYKKIEELAIEKKDQAQKQEIS